MSNETVNYLHPERFEKYPQTFDMFDNSDEALRIFGEWYLDAVRDEREYIEQERSNGVMTHYEVCQLCKAVEQISVIASEIQKQVRRGLSKDFFKHWKLLKEYVEFVDINTHGKKERTKKHIADGMYGRAVYLPIKRVLKLFPDSEEFFEKDMWLLPNENKTN